MDFKLVAQIQNFSLKDFSTFLLDDDLTIVAPKSNIIKKEFENHPFIYQAGLVALNSIKMNHCMFWEIIPEREKEKYGSNYIFLAHHLTAHLNKITSALWFVKDNSCYCPKSMLVINGGQNLIHDYRNIFMSNSLGKYTHETFTNYEIMLALKTQFLLEKYMPEADPFEVAKKEVDLNTLTNVGTLSTAKYSYNRITRAYHMLNVARSQSLLVLKISFYVATLECFFGMGEGEILDKIKLRVALVLRLNKQERVENAKLLANAYKVRSRYLHGDELINKHLQPDALPLISKQIDQLLRMVFLKVVNDYPDKFLLDTEHMNLWYDGLIFSE